MGYQNLKSISVACQESSCTKLKVKFVDELVTAWHNTLKEPYEKFVDAELVKLGYPFSKGYSTKDISTIKRKG